METTPAYPTLSLADDDRALLQRAVFAKFDLPSLILNDAHPAQRTLCSLVAWLEQPHIRAASDAIIATFKRAETYAKELRESQLHKTIEQLLAATLSIVTTQQTLDPAHNADAPAPDSPGAKALLAATSRALATIREGRQLVSAAIKAGLQAVAPRSSRAPRSSNTDHSSSRSASASEPDSTLDSNPEPLSGLADALAAAQRAKGDKVLLAG